MATRRLIRRFSAIASRELPYGHFDSLQPSLRGEARRVANIVHAARKATAVAAARGSDDEERKEALTLVKTSLELYVGLVSKGNPPVVLTQSGNIPSRGDADEDSSTEDVPTENEITALLGPDVEAMKNDIFQSNKQRIWFGWRGWF